MAASAPSTGAQAVLVVDDDVVHREAVRMVLRRHGVQVEEAASGGAALTAFRTRRFDLALLDERLPDITGLQIARTLASERIWAPWLLMSGWLDAEMVFEAGRLGALSVVLLPFDIEAVVLSALATVRRGATWPPVSAIAVPAAGGCTTDRVACWIVVAGSAEGDLKTHDRWARFLDGRCGKVTSRRVTDLCAVAGLEAIQVRDLMRVLRALWHAGGQVAYVGAHLDVEKEQTLRSLLHRGGLDRPDVRAVSLEEFLCLQRFVPGDHPLLPAILAYFPRSSPPPARARSFGTLRPSLVTHPGSAAASCRIGQCSNRSGSTPPSFS
jgi:DNA-binding response OmpR family regulator